MNCPKCGKPMEMYERFWDYDDGESLIGAEHYVCTNVNCDRDTTYSCDVSYILRQRGELEE